ncbi:MAG TPA: 4-phosphoerythronate dehydrogenase [Ignavibacteriaceae bacterium]|nr:4-phosphoerythronate dehydrogenase [Ignavibacterium sp.]HRN26010.1 4-phosphoerythronate dehydrogenase [Ignavibacteriaceae bacterium]HRP91346.1 4-phosphoerythronate dehydrogenase [Ignavibacteriaceae bacterium]HRQ53630.1 4-phosphoerythronate dehydrogenase [Ignavibacteriaceae bacterium]
MLKIVVDENIAFAKTAFNQFGDVTLLSGRKITNAILKSVDVLIVRSITNVNEDLLEDTKVRFVGTATIGTDHIDLDYLKKNNIAFADAKGCNAYSVAEYIVAVILNLSVRFDFKLSDKSIGIVGVGNVGSKVAAFAQALGMKALLNDPPLQRSGDKRNFVSLDEIFSADIITLHTPLNLTGIDKTFHLFDKENINKIKDGAILINSSRGAVINNIELLNLIDKKNLKVVLDVWENEPNVNVGLLQKVMIATPHIAGYSYEGKVNGTKMIYNSLCDYLGEEKHFSFDLKNPPDQLKQFDVTQKLEASLNSLISSIYNIKDDVARMRKTITMNESERILEFDLQRKNYPNRREFNNYKIKSENLSEEIKNILKILRFNLIT